MAFPAAAPYIVPIGLIFTWFMVWMNLRGTSESGNVFALPTYLFILCMLALVGKGLFDWAMGIKCGRLLCSFYPGGSKENGEQVDTQETRL